MAIEYLGLSEVNGPLVVLEGVKNASYEEIVEFTVDGNEKKLGRIVAVYEDKAVIQVFEGTLIAKKHGGIGETITVRRISYGVGCEKVFPVHSPRIAMVETVRKGKVRRAKLYYLRDRFGKAAKVREKV